jgi:hypothetical protein
LLLLLLSTPNPTTTTPYKDATSHPSTCCCCPRIHPLWLLLLWCSRRPRRWKHNLHLIF